VKRNFALSRDTSRPAADNLKGLSSHVARRTRGTEYILTGVPHPMAVLRRVLLHSPEHLPAARPSEYGGLHPSRIRVSRPPEHQDIGDGYNIVIPVGNAIRRGLLSVSVQGCEKYH
jgi:hypothetical protein